jgi:hypothetical protein
MLLHKAVIQALSVAVNEHDERYALGGIHIDPSGAAVATDGHIMLYARTPATIPVDEYPSNPTPDTAPIDAAGTVDGQTIPIGALAQAAKHIRGKQTLSACDHIAVTPNDTGLRVVAIDGRSAGAGWDVSDQHVAPLEGRFPNWDQVIPKQTTTLTVRLSARILADLAKAAKAVGGHEPQVTFEFTDEGNGGAGAGYIHGIKVKLASVDGHDVGGVVMPMRK